MSIYTKHSADLSFYIILRDPFYAYCLAAGEGYSRREREIAEKEARAQAFLAEADQAEAAAGVELCLAFHILVVYSHSMCDLLSF